MSVGASCLHARRSNRWFSYTTLTDISRRLDALAARDNRSIAVAGRAAVLLPLVPNSARDDISLLFCVRPSHMRMHAGEVCFPGGRRDPQDVSDVEVALREAKEEIGLEQKDVQLLGQLDQIVSFAGLLVTPYVAVLPPDFESPPGHVPNDEVAESFAVPVSLLTNAIRSGNCIQPRLKREPPLCRAFRYNTHNIWGMTWLLTLRLAYICWDLKLDPTWFYNPRLKHKDGSPMTWMEYAQQYTTEQQVRLSRYVEISSNFVQLVQAS